MSYNITNWRTKRLERLQLPAATLRFPAALQQRGFRTRATLQPQDCISIETLGGEIAGFFIVPGTLLQITAVNLYGEGSGTFYQEVFVPALRQSTGTLEAVIIWEGGDSITRLTAVDGVVLETAVEL